MASSPSWRWAGGNWGGPKRSKQNNRRRIAAYQGRAHTIVVEIRDARVEDAHVACQVIRRSIIELCAADHRHDPAILSAWLANKTPENVEIWITQPGASLLIAAEGDSILGVGSVTDAGSITLNYVSPDARFRGVSRALLAAMEARAAERGNVQVSLNSTETAKRFYLAAGYVEDGPPASLFGTQAGYPMKKRLGTLPSGLR